MYRSPLLQTPLPQPTRPLPDLYTVRQDVDSRDSMRVGVRGLGSVPVPPMVLEAMDELWRDYWVATPAEQQRIAAGWPQMVLLLTCRHEERGYVDCERVASSATPSPPAASASA